MIRNLAELHPDERAAMEHEKAQSYLFWQQNLERAKGEAAKIRGEKDRKKGKWAEWARAEIAALQPDQYRSMVEREVNRP
ncbi:hypothetical protein TUM18999_46770 [Pseudomonas tohonis]|uniref:Uncharacterized protein n=1 Tax=Pseudomonas tohonis TaxID=2725477 RepID=A0A6J4EB59_9PSED|nr:hypothetical protein [Pseudomonas tohonis]BCG26486.1 hypothetical protein TUM18999_46770 [Pseudomonas tohonis]